MPASRPRSRRVGTRAVLAVAAVAAAFSVAFATYTGTSAVTISGTSVLGDVASVPASFSVVQGETATKSMGALFSVTSLDGTYDDSMTFRVFLLNAPTLLDYYDYTIFQLKVQYTTNGGTTWTDTGAVGYLSHADAELSLVPGHDFGAAPTANDQYRVTGTITYHNRATAGLVAPSFFLEIAQ